MNVKGRAKQEWMFNFGWFSFGFLMVEMMWEVVGWRGEGGRRALRRIKRREGRGEEDKGNLVIKSDRRVNSHD